MTSRSLAHPWRLLIMVGALYLTQGVPLGVAMEALPSLLRQDGAPLGLLSLLPLVGLPWIVKFLWAPYVDNLWSVRWGKRRSWILPMQGLVALSLTGAALIGISATTTGVVIALLVIAALASATQDTATDGLATEQFEGPMLVRANTVQVASTMIGFFLGGSGCLILAGLFGRTLALLTMAGIALLAFTFALFWREPVSDRRSEARPRASLLRFIRRSGALPVLFIGFATAMTANAAFGLSKLFLVDRGWTLDAIGRIGVAGGVATILLGCGGGGWLIGRIGLWRVLLCGIISSGLGAMIWMLLASTGGLVDQTTAMVAVLLGSVGSGSASVAAMTLAMRFAAGGDQAGTDMTAVQSTRDFGELATSSAVTALAAAIGYGSTFGAAVLAAIVIALVAGVVLRRSIATNAVSGERND